MVCSSGRKHPACGLAKLSSTLPVSSTRRLPRLLYAWATASMNAGRGSAVSSLIAASGRFVQERIGKRRIPMGQVELCAPPPVRRVEDFPPHALAHLAEVRGRADGRRLRMGAGRADVGHDDRAAAGLPVVGGPVLREADHARPEIARLIE